MQSKKNKIPILVEKEEWRKIKKKEKKGKRNYKTE